MQIEKIQNNRAIILQISGRLDGRTAIEFSNSVADALRQAPERLVLDLASVDYISSAGLRILIQTAKDAPTTNTHFALCALCANVTDVLEISGLTKLLSIYPHRQEAV